MPVTLVIVKQNASPASTCTLVLARMSRQTRQCLHLRWDKQVPTRREAHLVWDRLMVAARQCLHLRYSGMVYTSTRQGLHLLWGRAFAVRQCVRLWWSVAYMPRQCLRLTWDALPTPRQGLHLIWDARPVARQGLHLQWDAALPARQCLQLVWEARPAARQGLHLQWGAAAPSRQTLRLIWDMRPVARQSVRLIWDMRPVARQSVRLIWDKTMPARQGLHLVWDAKPAARQYLHLRWDRTPTVRRCLHLIWGAEHDVAPGTRVTIAGTPVSPIAIRVTESADQAAITATLEFAEALPPGLGPPAPVIIEIFGIRYALAGESYSRSREFGSRSWTLTAASPAYRLQSRYADDVSGELVGMASAIAGSLAGGIPVDWRMVDWQVLPGRLSPTGQAPLDAIRDLVSAAGGRLTSARDGILVAMPWPPHSPADWPAQVEAETDSLSAMISISDDADERELKNAVTVSDEADAGDLRIEEIPDTRIGGRAEVWVYQIPWRDDFDTRHTAAGWAVLQDLGIEERVVEAEMLEIVDGRGRTQHPIYGVVAARWNKIDLGAITPAEDGTITTAIPAESLLYLTYKTKARRLLVDMREAHPEPIMLIAED